MERDAAEGQRLLSLIQVGLVKGGLQDNIADVEQAGPRQLHRVQVAIGRDQDVRSSLYIRAVEDPKLRAHELGGADRAGIRSCGLSRLGLNELANRLAGLKARFRPGAEPLHALLPPPEHRARL